MTTRQRNDGAVNALRMIPTKWAAVLVGVAIAYVVLQPRLNQWFGWNLPSVARMMGDEKPAAKKPKEKETAAKNSKNSKAFDKETSPEEDVDEQPTKTSAKPKVDSDDDDLDPLYGFLTEVGSRRYESPAGLVYGPGSDEGHRLKHIARHLVDQPDRPGSHGVFKGGMKAFLVAIDDAYLRAKKGAKGTTKEEDYGSMVYVVTFEKTIGFIGGEEGGRKKNPATKKIQLVVRGSNLITAFPF